MTGQQSRFAASHVRAVVVQAIGDVAIPARFRAIVDALLARVVGFPTTGGGAFPPVDVAGVALPATGDAAIPYRSPDHDVAGLVRAVRQTGAANGRVPAPESRVFLAIPVHAAGDQNCREYLVIRAAFGAGLPGKRLPRCRCRRQIAAG